MIQRVLLTALAITLSAIFAAETASGETWFCAVNEKAGGVQIKEFHVENNKLKEMTSDKLLRESFQLKKGPFLGENYNILQNDKKSIIAESDFSGINSQNKLEIIVVNIIITKINGNLLRTKIFIFQSEPSESETVSGSCTSKAQ